MPGLGPSSKGKTLYVPLAKQNSQWDALSDIVGSGLVTATAGLTFLASCDIVGSGDVSAAAASVTWSASADVLGTGLVSATGALSLGSTVAIAGSGIVGITVRGIYQVGGVSGGDIFYDDDSNAHASLDAVAGSYHFEDLYQRSQAAGWKAVDGVTGAVEKWGGAVFGLLPEYWFHVNIQNGDGISAATTTLKASRCSVKFDAGKTMKMSSVGIANRWTILGTKQETAPGAPVGYDGCEITLGASTTIDGNHQLYGTKFRTVGANVQLNIRRTSTSATGDAVNVTVDALGTGAAATIGFGTAAVPSGRAHHVYLNSLGSATAGVSLFNVQDASDIHFDGIANNAINIVSAYTRLRNGVVHGTPPSVDLRGSSGGTDLIDFTWSGAAAQQTSSSPTWDWRTFLPTTVDALGNPQAGELIELFDGSMTLVVSAVTDLSGQIAYTALGQDGNPISNAVKTRVKGATWVDQGPFTLRRNGLTVDVFTWPKTSYVVAGTTYYQLLAMYGQPIGPAETLKAAFGVNPGGGPPPLVVQFTDLSTTRPGDAITAWAWEFGDGQTSALQNPLHTYTVEGLYAVKLTVTDSSGTDSLTVVGAIFVQAQTSKFQRRFVPATPYVHQDEPAIPAFVRRDILPVEFVRQAIPGGAYRPCGDPPSTIQEGEAEVIFGGVVVPVSDPRPVFTHRQGPTTAFRRRGVPAVSYEECGTPPPPETEPPPPAPPTLPPLRSPLGVAAKVGSFTTDGNATQAVTGIGFRPKALIVATVATTPGQDSAIQADQHISIGICAGPASTSQRFALVRSVDGVNPSSCAKELGDALFGIMSSPTALAQAGRLQSFDNDGFTITKPVNVSNGYRVYYAAIGGTDLTGAKVSQFDIDGTVSAQPYTGLGLLPELLLFLGTRGQNTAVLPGTLNMDTHSTMALGAVSAPASRWSVATSGRDAQTLGASLGAVSTQRSDRCLQLCTVEPTPQVEKYAELVSSDSDGFTLNQTEPVASSARREAVMAFKGPRSSVGKLDRLTGAATIGFRPRLVILVSVHRAANSVVAGDCQISFGISDGTTHGSVWSRLSDNQMPTVAKRLAKSGAALVTCDLTPAIDSACTVSFTDTGFSLPSSPSGATNDEIVFVALGDPETPAVTGTLPLVYQDSAAAFVAPEHPKPAYMVEEVEPTFRDPDYDTPTVTRVADTPGNTATLLTLPTSNLAPYTMTWGGRARHVYSKQQPWNYDESLFIMENRQSDSHNAVHVGDPTLILLDGQTMLPKYKLGPVATANLYDYRWFPSFENRNVLVNVTSDGKALQWIDVLQDQIVRSWDLSLSIAAGVTLLGGGEGNLSDDGRYVCLFKEVDPSGVTSNDADVMVVDMNQSPPAGRGPVLRVVSTDPVAQKTNRVVTWSSMAASGAYALLHWRGEKTQVLNLNPATLALSIRDLTSGSGFGSGVGGDQWVSANYVVNTVIGSPNVSSGGLFPSGIEGMKITGPGIPAGTIVKTFTDSSNIVMGQNATANGTAVTARIGDEADKGYIWRMGHADTAKNPQDSNSDVIIGQDQRFPIGDSFNGRAISSVLMTRLSDGSPTSLTQPTLGGVQESSSHHLSCRAKRRTDPGWVYVSWFEKTSAADRRFQQEIAAHRLLQDAASSGFEVERFAHHHSDESTLGGNPSTYQSEPHACPSWFGDRIIFASDWARQCDSGCGDNSYTGGYPSGVYQDYLVKAAL